MLVPFWNGSGEGCLQVGFEMEDGGEYLEENQPEVCQQVVYQYQAYGYDQEQCEVGQPLETQYGSDQNAGTQVFEQYYHVQYPDHIAQQQQEEWQNGQEQQQQDQYEDSSVSYTVLSSDWSGSDSSDDSDSKGKEKKKKDKGKEGKEKHKGEGEKAKKGKGEGEDKKDKKSKDEGQDKKAKKKGESKQQQEGGSVGAAHAAYGQPYYQQYPGPPPQGVPFHQASGEAGSFGPVYAYGASVDPAGMVSREVVVEKPKEKSKKKDKVKEEGSDSDTGSEEEEEKVKEEKKKDKVKGADAGLDQGFNHVAQVPVGYAYGVDSAQVHRVEHAYGAEAPQHVPDMGKQKKDKKKKDKSDDSHVEAPPAPTGYVDQWQAPPNVGWPQGQALPDGYGYGYAAPPPEKEKVKDKKKKEHKISDAPHPSPDVYGSEYVPVTEQQTRSLQQQGAPVHGSYNPGEPRIDVEFQEKPTQASALSPPSGYHPPPHGLTYPGVPDQGVASDTESTKGKKKKDGKEKGEKHAKGDVDSGVSQWQAPQGPVPPSTPPQIYGYPPEAVAEKKKEKKDKSKDGEKVNHSVSTDVYGNPVPQQYGPPGQAPQMPYGYPPETVAEKKKEKKDKSKDGEKVNHSVSTDVYGNPVPQQYGPPGQAPQMPYGYPHEPVAEKKKEKKDKSKDKSKDGEKVNHSVSTDVYGNPVPQQYGTPGQGPQMPYGYSPEPVAVKKKEKKDKSKDKSKDGEQVNQSVSTDMYGNPLPQQYGPPGQAPIAVHKPPASYVDHAGHVHAAGAGYHYPPAMHGMPLQGSLAPGSVGHQPGLSQGVVYSNEPVKEKKKDKKDKKDKSASAHSVAGYGNAGPLPVVQPIHDPAAYAMHAMYGAPSAVPVDVSSSGPVPLGYASEEKVAKKEKKKKDKEVRAADQVYGNPQLGSHGYGPGQVYGTAGYAAGGHLNPLVHFQAAGAPGLHHGMPRPPPGVSVSGSTRWHGQPVQGHGHPVQRVKTPPQVWTAPSERAAPMEASTAPYSHPRHTPPQFVGGQQVLPRPNYGPPVPQVPSHVQPRGPPAHAYLNRAVRSAPSPDLYTQPQTLHAGHIPQGPGLGQAYSAQSVIQQAIPGRGTYRPQAIQPQVQSRDLGYGDPPPLFPQPQPNFGTTVQQPGNQQQQQVGGSVGGGSQVAYPQQPGPGMSGQPQGQPYQRTASPGMGGQSQSQPLGVGYAGSRQLQASSQVPQPFGMGQQQQVGYGQRPGLLNSLAAAVATSNQPQRPIFGGALQMGNNQQNQQQQQLRLWQNMNSNNQGMGNNSNPTQPPGMDNNSNQSQPQPGMANQRQMQGDSDTSSNQMQYRQGYDNTPQSYYDNQSYGQGQSYDQYNQGVDPYFDQGQDQGQNISFDLSGFDASSQSSFDTSSYGQGDFDISSDVYDLW